MFKNFSSPPLQKSFFYDGSLKDYSFAHFQEHSHMRGSRNHKPRKRKALNRGETVPGQMSLSAGVAASSGVFFLMHIFLES